MKPEKIIVYSIFILIMGIFFSACNDKSSGKGQNTVAADSVSPKNHGLVGAWYAGEDLTRIGTGWTLDSFYVAWDAVTGRGSGWSAQWEGYITAPATANINFYGETSNEVILKISDIEILHTGEGNIKNQGSFSMKAGEKYHIRMFYLQKKGSNTFFRILWGWKGRLAQVVPSKYLSFNDAQARYWNYIAPPDSALFDFSKLHTVQSDNYFAYREPGRFAGWPANNGLWNWGNEILVSFTLGYYASDVSGGHSIDNSRPSSTVLSRSLDGGKTWTLEANENFTDSLKESPGINFSHPDFAMKVLNDRYFVSYNRGKSWEGAYKINIKSPGITIGNLTSRTDYIVLGPKKCMVFLSAETGVVESDYQDRAFCALTTDGGRIFEFSGWMTQDTDKRSVMPATVRIDEGHLVSVMRRKHEQKFGERPSILKNWIEAAESRDYGVTWTNLGKVADTDLGQRNGNPPAMIKLADGRLCVAYGYRDFPCGIRMKVSEDSGITWGKEIAIRSDGATWDLGYPRMVVNGDGKIVLIYYYTTKADYSQHIGVSIIDTERIN